MDGRPGESQSAQEFQFAVDIPCDVCRGREKEGKIIWKQFVVAEYEEVLEQGYFPFLTIKESGSG